MQLNAMLLSVCALHFLCTSQYSPWPLLPASSVLLHTAVACFQVWMLKLESFFQRHSQIRALIKRCAVHDTLQADSRWCCVPLAFLILKKGGSFCMYYLAWTAYRRFEKSTQSLLLMSVNAWEQFMTFDQCLSYGAAYEHDIWWAV
jgi:hypothetical protein